MTAFKHQVNNMKPINSTNLKTYKEIDYELLCEKLSKVDWTIITNSMDVDFTAEKLTQTTRDDEEQETRQRTNQIPS